MRTTMRDRRSPKATKRLLYQPSPHITLLLTFIRPRTTQVDGVTKAIRTHVSRDKLVTRDTAIALANPNRVQET
jgi:hypothetical protein